jgi:hypothetical protein
MTRFPLQTEITPWQCPICGTGVPISLWPVHCVCGYVQFHPRRGLGDHLACLLHRIGITRSRYIQAKSMLGLNGRCGCQERQEKLNAIGRKLGL